MYSQCFSINTSLSQYLTIYIVRLYVMPILFLLPHILNYRSNIATKVFLNPGQGHYEAFYILLFELKGERKDISALGINILEIPGRVTVPSISTGEWYLELPHSELIVLQACQEHIIYSNGHLCICVFQQIQASDRFYVEFFSSTIAFPCPK